MQQLINKPTLTIGKSAPGAMKSPWTIRDKTLFDKSLFAGILYAGIDAFLVDGTNPFC